MTAPLPLALALVGLIISAQTKLHAVVLGQPVTVSLLWLIAAAIVLLLAAAVLFLLRSVLRENLFLRPRMAQ